MDYDDIIKILTSTSKFKICLGLERIKALLELLGNPQDKINVIHVAGSNGKGSVCAILANILKCSGYKTGLYTSPHLIDYTERIRINGESITKDNFANLIESICTLADKHCINLTEFEILTASAFKYFFDNKVDIAVIETGLGGRLDASNVCKKPLCSIITSISLEHTDRLGNTIEKIAYEKAGIIKKDSNVIVSNDNNGYKIVEQQAKLLNSNILNANKNIELIFEDNTNYAVINNTKYEFPLLGCFQKQNLGLVLAAVELLRTKGYKIFVKEGLRTVKWSGRMEFIKEKNILIDGAHNPDSAKKLAESLNYYFPKQRRIFIYGTLNTKDYKTIAKILFKPDDEIYYNEFHHNNAVSYSEYKRNINIPINLNKNTSDILKRKELKIITGSLYMIGEYLSKFFNS